jgi:hypothetical protein
MFVMDTKMREANRERQRKYREAHRDEVNEKRRERYSSRVGEGRCPRCGGKTKKGHILCEECCKYQGELNRKYAVERKKAAANVAVAEKPKKAAAARKTSATKQERAAKAKK